MKSPPPFCTPVMNRILLLCLVSLYSCNCACQVGDGATTGQNPARSQQEVLVTPSNPASTNLTANNRIDKRSIKGVKGLIVLSDKYGKGDFVRFYNKDGSLWYEFTFYYDDSDGDFEYRNENFLPYSFHQDNFLLALKCVGEDKDGYKVVVNEETGLQKYFRKADGSLKFESWENHVLQSFSVTFEWRENPILEEPGGKVIDVNLSKIERFSADEIKGEWLRVKWDSEPNPNDDPQKAKFGWIKWKVKERLLID